MTQTPGATVENGARFAGTWKGRDLTVLGAFDGDAELSGRLHLAPGARFTGHVRAATVEVEGEFDGEVRAESLVFGAQARARGVFLAPRLTIRDGACVEGALNVDPLARVPADARGRGGGKAKAAPASSEPAAESAGSAASLPA